MEIKCYTDNNFKRRERKTFAVYSTLLRTTELCSNVRKIVINVTPTLWELDFELDIIQILRLAGVLKDYERLKELTLLVRPSVMTRGNWDFLGDFFRMADKRRQGVSLCLELLDTTYSCAPEDYAVGAMEERAAAERIIEEMTGKLCGRGAEVCICPLSSCLSLLVEVLLILDLGVGGVEYYGGSGGVLLRRSCIFVSVERISHQTIIWRGIFAQRKDTYFVGSTA